MDFLKKKPSPDDDDIIELTDIIEKGSEDSPVKNSANQAMETQMDSLFSGGNNNSQPIVPDDMDADIDALLAEMQPTDSPAASSPKAAPSLNVDEELDMPNMAEVDALLKGMDIPPQPTDIKESSLPSAADGASLDDLLDGLLDNPSSASPVAKPTASPSPTPKAPEAAPATASPPSSTLNLDDLDDLFAENAPSKSAATPPAAPAPAAVAAPTSSMNLDDLDALFAEVAPPKAAAAPAAPAPAASGNDLIDLDDLDALFAAEAPTLAAPAPAPAPAPASKVAPKASSQKTKLDDRDLSLDDALDALLGTAPASVTPAPEDEASADDDSSAPALTPAPAPAASAPTALPSAEAGNDLDDIDALLAASAQESSDSAKDRVAAPLETADNSANFRSIEDDLDDILGSVAPAPEPAPLSEDAAGEEPVDLSDLDTMSADEEEDFLADIFDTEKNDKKKPSSIETDLLDGLDVLDGLDDPIQPEETIVAAPSSRQAPGKQAPTKQTATKQDIDKQDTDTDTLDFSMFSADNPADMPAMPDKLVEDFPLPELDELDKLLQEAPAPLNDQAEELSLIRAEDSPSNSFTQDFTEEDIAQVAQELLDEKVRETASIDNVDTNAWLSSLDAVLEEEEGADLAHHAASTENLLPQQDAAVNLDNLLAHLSDAGEQNHYVYSPQVPRNSLLDSNNTASPLTSPCDPSVPSVPFGLAYEQELARLQQITDRFASSLVEADARIATLTQQAKSEVALDTLFRADSPFSASLQHAVGTAVAAELRTHSQNNAAFGSDSAPDFAAASAPDPAAAQAAAALADAHQQLQAVHSALTEKVRYLEEQVQNLHAQLEGRDEAQQALLERLSALEDGNKEARLQTVETHVKGQLVSTEALDEQYKQLESRLEAQIQQQANFEQHFQHEVEKAAAAAAARIIREEIAGILAGQG